MKGDVINMGRPKNPDPNKHGTRNPNGTGTYYKTKDDRYEWKQMKDRKVRTLSSDDLTDLHEQVKAVADLPIVKTKIKVSEWFERWLKNVKALKKPATYEQYRIIWEQHIKPVIGDLTMKKIKPSDIQDVIAKMNTKVVKPAKLDGNGKTIAPEKIGLSTCTMKHAKKIMHIAFAAALDDGLIAESPMRKIDIPKKQAKPRKTINTEELKILFDYLKNTRWYWAFRFELVTGLRRGEMLALKWSDIDYKHKQIKVDESDSISGAGDTKSSKEHYVPLSDLAEYYLSQQKEMLASKYEPAFRGKSIKKDDLIFPSKNGTMMKPDSLNSVLDRINEKAGIHVTPHMFRHTFVYMSKGRMSLSELQEALGHDQSTTTLDLYGTMLSDTNTAAKKIDESFGGLDEEFAKINSKVEQKNECKVIQFRKAK